MMHFIYFHDATAWGIQSAALGGPPWPVPADSDTVNEVCRRLHEHESLDELLTQLRQAHARLVRAARSAPDLDTPCFQRDRKSTRLNSSHGYISYAVFCLKKKNHRQERSGIDLRYPHRSFAVPL